MKQMISEAIKGFNVSSYFNNIQDGIEELSQRIRKVSYRRSYNKGKKCKGPLLRELYLRKKRPQNLIKLYGSLENKAE